MSSTTGCAVIRSRVRWQCDANTRSNVTFSLSNKRYAAAVSAWPPQAAGMLAVGRSLSREERERVGEGLSSAGATSARIAAAYGVGEGRVLWGECAVPERRENLEDASDARRRFEMTEGGLRRDEQQRSRRLAGFAVDRT